MHPPRSNAALLALIRKSELVCETELVAPIPVGTINPLDKGNPRMSLGLSAHVLRMLVRNSEELLLTGTTAESGADTASFSPKHALPVPPREQE